jgi:ankyrin repeat protein
LGKLVTKTEVIIQPYFLYKKFETHLRQFFHGKCLFFSYLLEHGADPLISDAEGNIALHWAALSGSKNTCELLLNHGCDVNATNSIGEAPM